MHPFISSLGRMTSYNVPSGSVAEVAPDPGTYDEEAIEIDEKRVYLHMHASGNIRLTLKDPASPDFTNDYWTTFGNDVELWYTGPVWVDGSTAVAVISGY